MRFKEFEGEWVERKLSEVTKKINSGKTPLGGESAYTNQGIPFIRSQNVNNNKLEIASVAFISNEMNEQMKNSIVNANDILLNITGASLGRSCVVPKDFKEGNVNQHVCIIRFNLEYNPRFVQPIFSSTKGQEIFVSLQTGSGREGLTFESIKGIKLKFPSKAEQDKIANFVSLLEDRIATQIKIIKELETLVKALREKLFSQQLRFKDGNGKNFSDWEEKRMSAIYSIKTTNSFSRDNLNYESGEVKNIHYGDIHTKFKSHFRIANEIVPFINAEISIEKINQENYCKVGDMVFADASEDVYDVGKSIEIVSLENQRVLSGLHTILARPDLNIIAIGFGGHCFKSENVRRQIQKEAQGTKVISISPTRLQGIVLSLPSKNEQTRIADFLSAVNEKIATEKSLLQQLEKQKQYFLQSLFI